MKAYINILNKKLEKNIDINQDFTLIKFENFNTPKIYEEVCDYFLSIFKNKDINFIAKLSREKYNQWKDINEFSDVLESMFSKGYIEIEESLTKWRNKSFLDLENKYCIFLLGAEAVEDKGGLEEFFKVSPEYIEKLISTNYDEIYSQKGLYFSNDEKSVINNLIESIFSYTSKDLIKLSNRFENVNGNESYIDIIKLITSNMYEDWKIANIIKINERDLQKKALKNKIELAYKFSKRIALEYNSDSKMTKVQNNINTYYSNYKDDIEDEIKERLKGYNSYDEFSKDLKLYLQGRNLNEVKDKILNVDHTLIASILKLKTSSDVVNNGKVRKIVGNPFKAFFLPILIEYSGILSKNTLKSIDIEIKSIKLSNTKDKDDKELKDKWKNLILFLGGIENLISNSIDFTNDNGEEIELNLYSIIDNCEIYPFYKYNTNEMVKNGILSSADNNKIKSDMKILFKFDIGSEVLKREYEWSFEDSDSWCNFLVIMNNLKFSNGIKIEQFIPIIHDKQVDELIECNNQKELIYLIKNKDYNIENIFDIIDNKYNSIVEINNLSKKFVDVINAINENGLFVAKDDFTLIPNLLGAYSDFCIKIKESVKTGEIEKGNLNLLTKSFMYLNDSDFYDKDVKGCVIPPFHPVMLERILEQYRYLSNGFIEIFNEIKSSEESISWKKIEKRFNRFIQLSSIKNSVEFMISANGYIPPKNSLGYYTIFGESKTSFCSSNMNIDYSLDDSEEYNVALGTPNSDNITKIVSDYINTYPSKIDGIKIAFFEPQEYKDIIVGLNSLIKQNKLDYKIELTIYTSDYRCIESKYFKYWIDDNFDEESNVTIKPRMKYLDLNSFSMKNNLDNDIEEADIIFINDVMSYKELKSEDFKKHNSIDGIAVSKYPVVYLPIQTNSKNTRGVLTSQPQFKCADDHAQMMVYINSEIVKDDNFNTVKIVELKQKTKEILNVLNEKTNWLVILDENIDREIISNIGNNIIAFATGKGFFGELNLSVSTNINYIDDLKRFLKRRLRKKFPWSESDITDATNNCIENIKDLDGAQIIKAINPSDESINEYLAFFITNKILEMEEDKDDKSLRRLISADSYNHIFDEKINFEEGINSRPDLILFDIDNIYEKELKIKIKVIECKLGHQNDIHVEKAKSQVASAIERINEIWDNNYSVQNRYWYNQLYRILAYNNSFENDNLFEILNKINYGDFEIEVSGEIFTYWIDSNSTTPIKKHIIDYNLDNLDIEITHNEISSAYMRSILVKNNLNIDNIEYLIEDEELKETIEINEIDTCYDDFFINNEFDNIELIEIPEVEEISGIEVAKERKKTENIIDCFEDGTDVVNDEEDLIKEKITRLKKELEFRNIKVIVENYQIGPDIIRIQLKLGFGVNISQIEKFKTDMKIWLSVDETPNIFIANSLVNIDIPRVNRQTIVFKDAILDTIKNSNEILKEKEDKLYVLLGADIVGKSRVIDLSDSNNPHLLVAGQTGSGKSVLLASMLTSMMVYYTPKDLEFWLVDPKYVELTVFEESPFTTKSVCDSTEVETMLKELTNEMNERYKIFKKNRVQNITAYNKIVSEEKRLKRIVGVIDEYGILMESGKEFVKIFETELKKLAQLSRAAGIHLIICTQSPKAEILTTTIRNNLPARVGLKVADSVASKLILDSSGAENLLGKGDMLLKTADSSNFVRCKSPFIKQTEIENVNEYFKKVGYNLNE